MLLRQCAAGVKTLSRVLDVANTLIGPIHEQNVFESLQPATDAPCEPARNKKSPALCGGTGLRKETVVLPWGATTSTGKSLNRATVGLDAWA
jgi:hypothetical protein